MRAAREHLTLDDLGEPALAFTVIGVPGPQGSKSPKGKTKDGRTIMVESSKKVKPWRLHVATVARETAGENWVQLDGPLVADMIFTLPAPVNLPKTLRRVPTTTPDLSKLLRSTEDALDTDASVIRNDSHIVAYRSTAKVYEGDRFHPDALPHPGAVIRLWRYPAHLLGSLVALEAAVGASW